MAHKDVEFAVDGPSGERVFKSFDEAAGYAVLLCVSDGKKHNIDVLIWSRAGAKAYGGDDAVEEYEDGPEASVFERFEIKVNPLGRVP